MEDKNALLKRIAELRAVSDRRQTPTVSERRAMLKSVRQLLTERRDSALAALEADLGKCATEALITEYRLLLNELNYLISRLPKLARTRRCGVALLNWPAAGRVVPEPYGSALVVATWNYPLLLSLEPVLGAIAAGNRVVLKLSPRSRQTMHFVRWLLETSLPAEFVIVVGDEISFSDILSEKFDYIFYTGNTAGGREVLSRAAANLTPATLEMGGKSPCIVASGANLRRAARRIVWGKCINAGQTCIAPDYLLVERSIQEPLTRELARAIRELYGTVPLDSPDYARLCDTAAYERLSKLASHGRLLTGGEKRPDALAIAPTVIDRLDDNDPLLTGEIFGPLLPVVGYISDEELFAKLGSGREKPLALYCFGGSRALRDRLRRATSSGALVFDDVMTHFINPDMPFGGVGTSGMGAYHGRRTFDTFTHMKPVFYRSKWFDWSFRFPPYSGWRARVINWLTR